MEKGKTTTPTVATRGNVRSDYLDIIDELKIVGKRKIKLIQFIDDFIQIIDNDKLTQEQFIEQIIDLISPIILDEEQFYIDYYIIFVIGSMTDLGITITSTEDGYTISVKLPDFDDDINEDGCNGDCENCDHQNNDDVKTLIHAPMSGCFGGQGEGQA